VGQLIPTKELSIILRAKDGEASRSLFLPGDIKTRGEGGICLKGHSPKSASAALLPHKRGYLETVTRLCEEKGRSVFMEAPSFGGRGEREGKKIFIHLP